MLILEILATFTEHFICYIAALDFFHKDDQKPFFKAAVMALISTPVIAVCNTVATVSQFTVVISILLFAVLISIFIHTKFFYGLVYGASYMTLLLVTEMFFISVISVAVKDPNYIENILVSSNPVRIAYIVFMKVVNAGLYILTRGFLVNASHKILKQPAYILSVVMGVAMTLGIMSCVNENNINSLKIALSIFFIIFLIINCLIIFLVNRIFQNNIEAEKQASLAAKNRILEDALKANDKLYEENSKRIHEFKHHIAVIKAMCDSEQYEQLDKYLNQIAVPTKYTYEYMTGNKIADMVLNVKSSIMKEQNIKFICVADNIKDVNINDGDMCSLISNLLDNAIEANTDIGDKYVKFKIIKQGNIIVLIVSNPCKNTGDKFISEKGPGHGWGIKIIKDIAQRYNGKYQAEINNGTFIVRVMLIE